MNRATKQDWQDAKDRWEAEPKVGFPELAEALGVSRQAVRKRATKEGWERVQTQSTINAKAQAQADRLTERLHDLNEVINPDPPEGPTTEPDNQQPDPVVPVVEKVKAADLAVELRTKLIQTHRSEWRAHARTFTMEGMSLNIDVGRKAKLSAEVLAVRQKSERIAWGLDDEANRQKPEVNIVGFRVVQQ